MKLKQSIGLSVALLTATSAWAGDVGNGGDVVVCRDANGKILDNPPVELLDFYEGKMPPRNMTVDLGGADLSVDQKVELALSRLEKYSPLETGILRRDAQNFMNEAVFWPGVELEDIPDSAHIGFPRGCKVEQIVNQNEPKFPEDKRYTISADLWEKLDSNNRAGLILHEVIFKYARRSTRLGIEPWWLVENSISTRYLNMLLVSNKISQLNVAAYSELLKKIQILSSFSSQSDSGAQIWARVVIQDTIAGEPTFYQSGKLKSGLLREHGQLIKVGAATIKAWGQIEPRLDERALSSARVNLYESGHTESFTLFENIQMQVGETQLRCRQGTEVSFFESGSLRTCVVVDSAAVRIGGKEHKVGRKIGFHENGSLALISGSFSREVEVERAGEKFIASGVDSISFAPNGDVLSFTPRKSYRFSKPANVVNEAGYDFVTYFPERETATTSPIGRIEYWENGNLKFATIESGTLQVGNRSLKPRFGLVKLFENGELEEFDPNTDQKTISFDSNGRILEFATYGRLYFYEGLRIRAGVLAKATTFESIDGEQVTVPKASGVELSEDGKLMRTF